MTISYQLYSPDEGPYLGVIPKEYVATLGGETYKYASPISGGAKKSRRRRRRTTSLRKKNRRTRTRTTRARKSFR
uniref:Uncharacterized protein n=1 Tax=viral metagenome TaxID=1070528 RepID=A0A6C0D625_9ZZZZ